MVWMNQFTDLVLLRHHEGNYSMIRPWITIFKKKKMNVRLAQVSLHSAAISSFSPIYFWPRGTAGGRLFGSRSPDRWWSIARRSEQTKWGRFPVGLDPVNSSTPPFIDKSNGRRCQQFALFSLHSTAFFTIVCHLCRYLRPFLFRGLYWRYFFVFHETARQKHTAGG